MDVAIGFVILNHGNSPQLVRLINRLNKTFDSPKIVCHNDFSQCPLDLTELPVNVTFVLPHVHTRWGHISVVHAFLGALKLLYRTTAAPDWFVLLSGSDYPIRPAHDLRTEFGQARVDAFIHSRRVSQGSDHKDWNNAGYERYCCRAISLPSLTKRLRYTHRTLVLPRLNTPFNDAFQCYSGEHWFSGNHRAADCLLSGRIEHRRLLKAYETAASPDESYYQTVLCNEAGLKVHPETLHYARWVSPGDAHPKTLCDDDYQDMMSSGKYFARKFDANAAPGVLDMIDRALDQRAGAASPFKLA
jgi:hypothetical protein